MASSWSPLNWHSSVSCYSLLPLFIPSFHPKDIPQIPLFVFQLLILNTKWGCCCVTITREAEDYRQRAEQHEKQTVEKHPQIKDCLRFHSKEWRENLIYKSFHGRLKKRNEWPEGILFLFYSRTTLFGYFISCPSPFPFSSWKSYNSLERRKLLDKPGTTKILHSLSDLLSVTDEESSGGKDTRNGRSTWRRKFSSTSILSVFWRKKSLSSEFFHLLLHLLLLRHFPRSLSVLFFLSNVTLAKTLMISSLETDNLSVEKEGEHIFL